MVRDVGNCKVEGTISQGVRAFGLRRSRYRGLARTHLQHVATAAAIDLARLGDWLRAIPRAATRVSRFAARTARPRRASSSTSITSCCGWSATPPSAA